MTLRAWGPAARGLPTLTIGAALALAAAPTAVVLLDGGRDLTKALLAAGVIGAATASFWVEDPAGETLSASPTSLARRRVLRLGAIALGLAVTCALLVAAAAVRGTLTLDEIVQRSAEVAAVSGLAAAIGGSAERHGVAGAARSGAVGGSLAVLMVSGVAQRFHTLPSLGVTQHHGRWWLVALAAWATAAWSSRDPSR